MVINYIPLNFIIIDIKWPLPNKEDLINRISKDKIFSKFDCKLGYY